MIWKVGSCVWWPSLGRVRHGEVVAVRGPQLEVRCVEGLHQSTVFVAVVACCHSEDAARELMRAWATAPGPKKPHHKYRGRR